jgi:hypothetical protein
VAGFETMSTHCPYCGESIRLLVDPLNFGQEYVEDCSVCCRPITVSAQPGGTAVDVRQENDC